MIFPEIIEKYFYFLPALPRFFTTIKKTFLNKILSAEQVETTAETNAETTAENTAETTA